MSEHDHPAGVQHLAPVQPAPPRCRRRDDRRAAGHPPGARPLAALGDRRSPACQRVFWLCDFAGEPGAETTPFTNAAYDCPGDDDLEHVLSADDLVEALDSTFRIVEGCLDRWTPPMLEEEIRRPRVGRPWCTPAAGSSSASSPTTSTTSPSSTRRSGMRGCARSTSGTERSGVGGDRGRRSGRISSVAFTLRGCGRPNRPLTPATRGRRMPRSRLSATSCTAWEPSRPISGTNWD